MTKQTANGATEAEKLVEVRLLRNYVPLNAEFVTPEEDPNTKIYVKRLAGEVVGLPRSEAKDVIAKGIAEITADLV
jgi:hypothetical protein